MSFWSVFSTVFATVFLAEIGDKTQLATMLFATKEGASKWAIFFGSAAALVVAAGIGVLVGEQLGKWISPKTLKWIAGLGFVAIGVWTMLSGE
ncbi:MAG: TMEM165/GDT1 family protein [Chloroherpetonaceae bacterium]|nr:TMEM165/GDT1 family protein [Chloroherpetonaceae bacterium]MDW8437865.1 TMEM165/GDT1 family protein [Chloroherpetonaceae bacterium]